MDFVVRGASQYPIWLSDNKVPPVDLTACMGVAEDNAPGGGRALVSDVDDLTVFEATPAASTAADRALAAVAEIAASVMPSSSQMSSPSAISQVHLLTLKLASPIKDLANGMHNLERRLDEAVNLIGILKKQVKSTEERTLQLKSQQMAVLAAAKKTLTTVQNQSDRLEFDRCIEPRSSAASPVRVSFEARLHEVEERVNALLEWQEEEAMKGLTQVVQRGSKQDLSHQDFSHIIQTNCNMLKSLHETVSHLEKSRASSAGPASASLTDAHELWQRVQKHMQDNYYTRGHIDELVNEIEAKANLRLSEDALKIVQTSGSSSQLTEGNAQSVLSTINSGGRLLRGIETRIDRSEARLDKSIIDLTDRLDPLQNFVDQQRLASWQAGRKLPEVSQKLDQLWAQCQHYFAKVKEHDVHFSFFRNSFESHKQHCLDMGSTFETTGSYRPSDRPIFPSSSSATHGAGIASSAPELSAGASNGNRPGGVGRDA